MSAKAEGSYVEKEGRMKFDLLCFTMLWALPVLLGLLSMRVTGVAKGRLQTDYRFGGIGALVILIGAFILILMLVIMGDMRDWDRFHQMTIMSHGGIKILKWVGKVFLLTGLLFILFTLFYITSCVITDELLNHLYQKKVLGFRRTRSRIIFGIRRRRNNRK